ncbi:GTPase ObgE [Helcococcus ovis]|uniref:GTPase ObgE n=1 Tax=Helcococcus ovis TaxID=72026 RepID=UPI00106FB79B|nr:GTPase ObgE [Helcococcus ovis]TFF67051.1 GTPase ObgE [Helcococcus ovis]WNZ01815.1 GTPase ObgE [Helcococcus ovis]
MFLDVAKIILRSGAGGDGAIAWRREIFEPAGGPAGGDGGDGGSVILKADSNVQTLLDFKYRRHFFAQNGEPGRNKKQYGKKGEDLYVKVPVGTIVREAKSNKVICDLIEDGEEFIIAKGGKGGKGNAKFANSIRQAPKFAQPGENAQEIEVILEVKLIADIGLIGLPNVGKSSLLSILSDAKPKIANYHFTTLTPNLGVVKIDFQNNFVIADIPGLIDGASEGIGLGHQFLKHVERTRLLVHVLDMAGSEGRDPIDDFNIIMKELSNYSDKLREKDLFVVANKMDLPNAVENLEIFKLNFPELKVIETSAATTNGIEDLKYYMFERLKDIKKDYHSLDEDERLDLESFFKVDRTIEVNKKNGEYIVKGYPISELIRKTNFDDYESLRHFEAVLEKMGVMAQLEELGIEDGDTIHVESIQIEYFG